MRGLRGQARSSGPENPVVSGPGNLHDEGVSLARTVRARRARRGWATALTVLALLTGCGGPTDETTGPDLALPAVYPEASTAGTASPGDDAILDPVLRDLIERALAGNRDLRVATLRVAEARAVAGIQRADRLPTLAAGAAAARASVPADLGGEGRRTIERQFGLSVGFTTWEIDFWGRIGSLETAALESYLGTAAARRAARAALVAQVAETYLSLRELDERLALARQAAASREESLRISRRRVELGAASRLESTQVELLLRQAETLVAVLEQARATQAHALDVVVGSSAPVTPDSLPLAAREVVADVAPGVPSELLTRRPDILAAEHELRAARANVAAARAAFFPRIALTASAGFASEELDNLVGADARAWNFAPTLSVPIFDGGRLRASLDATELRREQSVARYERAVQSAFRDVADALSARRWLAAQETALLATARTLEERARLAGLRHASGSASHLEVLDAERDLLAIGQERVRNRRARLSARIALLAALGGGAGPDDLSR